MEKDDFIKDWLNEETSGKEREELEQIISFTERLSVPEKTSQDEAWDQFISNIEEQSSPGEKVMVAQKTKPSTWLIWAGSVAAALVIGYFTLFNQGSGDITVNTGIAEMATQVLPDQSEVTLNANSVLSYDQQKWSTARNLTLTGEAFFEVEEGSAFTVNTSNGSVTVLGTSFNVFSRNEALEVQCFTGKVQVAANGESVILTANQSATIDDQSGRLSVQEFNPQTTATWRIGEFYFDAVALSEVVAELERQFDIEINLTVDISNRFYTGFFSTQSLSEALQLVFVPMGLNSTVSGSIVTVE